MSLVFCTLSMAIGMAMAIQFVFCESDCVSPDKEIAKTTSKFTAQERALLLLMYYCKAMDKCNNEKNMLCFFPNAMQHKLWHSAAKVRCVFDGALMTLC